MIPSGVPGEKILARYTNGKVAAMSAPYGAGRIGVVGPHPPKPRGVGIASQGYLTPTGSTPYGHKLINSTMR